MICHRLLPPPALRERRHRGLARRLVAVCGRAVFVLAWPVPTSAKTSWRSRIVMVRVPANDLFRPNQFFMRLEDFASGADDKPDCNAARDQWIEECVAG